MYWTFQQDGVSRFLDFFGRRGLVNCQWAYHMLRQRVLMRVDRAWWKSMEVYEILTNLYNPFRKNHQNVHLTSFLYREQKCGEPKSDLPELLEMSDTQVSLCHCSRLNGIGFQSAPDRVSQLVGWFEAGVLSIVMNGSKINGCFWFP